ncbi:hypothetical protein R3P38DRAFT_2821864 [Favolaschia claudopus]|uniref:GDP-fucose protein O-fucosyltransferase 2 n=1 Tax=Favolaschia claudopus TaxID=2862362 RepID=A0AAW0EIU8_9AGAR
MLRPNPHFEEEYLEDSDWSPAPRGSDFQAVARRRLVWTARITLAVIAFITMFAIWNPQFTDRLRVQSGWVGPIRDLQTPEQRQLTIKLDPLSSVNGLPTDSFRDNLRPETQYITSWGSGGWSNDVIGTMNLIYLGIITDRVPVLPVFLPSYFMLNNLGNDHSPLPFSDIFDLPRLRRAIKTPIVEWQDVKAQDSMVRDDIGCWNVWESIQYHDKNPRKSFGPWYSKLEISYTKTPEWVKIKKNFEHDRSCSFWALASLAFPSARNKNLVPPLPTKQNVTLAPDEQMVCYDFVYYAAAHQSDELEQDYSPAWRSVGQHMHWATRVERLGTEYLRQTLSLDETEPIPPFIAVHARHNDFQDWCEEGVPVEDCFAPLSAFQSRVQAVRDEVRQRKGIEVEHIIMTSDETNHTWWRDVEDLGWRIVDHSRTTELHGLWYSILIDAFIQSRASAFVGTARSTVSTLASRRVQSWQDGPTIEVKWGKPNADSGD